MIGHRGGCLLAQENTLLAFRLALENGASDMLELDVCLSADGIPVVAHDEDLGRLTGLALHVGQVVAADPSQLPLLADVLPLHFPTPAVAAFHRPEGQERQRLCTLREVFTAFPGTPLHIDLKQPSPALVAAVVALVREFGREPTTILGSVGAANAAALRARATPEMLTFSSLRDVVCVYLLHLCGALPFVPVWFDTFDIPLPTPSLLARGGRRAPLLLRAAAALLEAPALWRHLRARGCVVYGFVLNDVADFAHVVGWPLDGVMSDDPVALRAFVRRTRSAPGTWPGPSA